MKKCKHCNGNGFVFGTILVTTNKTFFGFPVTNESGVKKVCSKCYGKGIK